MTFVASGPRQAPMRSQRPPKFGKSRAASSCYWLSLCRPDGEGEAYAWLASIMPPIHQRLRIERQPAPNSKECRRDKLHGLFVGELVNAERALGLGSP